MVGELRDDLRSGARRRGRRAAQDHSRCRARPAHRTRPAGGQQLGPRAGRACARRSPTCCDPKSSRCRAACAGCCGRGRRPKSERIPCSMPSDVAETEALIDFVGTCRYFASELAINEMTQRTFPRLQQYLDSGTPRAARRPAPCRRGRPQLPPVAGRCGGALLRQGVRARTMPRCSPRRPRSRGQRRAQGGASLKRRVFAASDARP